MTESQAATLFNDRRFIGPIWMLVGLALALMTIFPLLWMVSIAFKPQRDMFDMALVPVRPTFENFVYVFTHIDFVRYLFNSALVSSVATLVALLFHSMAGYALARLRFPGRDAIFLVMFST